MELHYQDETTIWFHGAWRREVEKRNAEKGTQGALSESLDSPKTFVEFFNLILNPPLLSTVLS